MSDSEQTVSGQGFWKDRMGESARKGYKVGLVDFLTSTVHWIDAIEDKAWGKHKAYRFIISNP